MSKSFFEKILKEILRVVLTAILASLGVSAITDSDSTISAIVQEVR